MGSCVSTLGSQLLGFCYVAMAGLEFSVLRLAKIHLLLSPHQWALKTLALVPLVFKGCGTFRRLEPYVVSG